MKNKYARRSKISEGKVRELVRYFAADLTALQAATPSGLNRNTVNRFYRGLRERILLDREARRPLFGVVEVDESLFGARRVEGRRGRGAYGKTVVFGIFERRGQVYTEIVPDCSRPTLQGIIRGRVDPSTVINSDGWRGYNGLVDLGYGHFRVDHSNDEFAKGAVHINGIEGFWGLAKVRLAKFKGLPRHTLVKSRLFCSFLQTSQAPMSSSNSAGSTNQLISKYRFPESHSSLVSIHNAVTNRKQDSRFGKILTTRVLRLIS